jgi:phage-related protein (TIGR01555 family)
MGQAPIGSQFMGYPGLQSLTQNAMVAACIDTVADDQTRAWIDITTGGKKITDEDKEADIRLTDAAKELGLQRLFNDAAIMAGYYGGCLIFIDTGDPSVDLSQPLNFTPWSAELKRGARVRFVLVDPINCFPGAYNSFDPLARDYYVPQSWWVNSRQVHASRLIHVHSGLPPVLLRPSYNFFGIPHAQIIYDYILHFQKCRVAAQTLLTKFSLTVLKTDMASGIMQGGGFQALDNRIAAIARYRDNDSILAINNGGGDPATAEDILNVTTPLSGVWEIVKQSLELVAAVNRTPAVKLLGISPSGFNATGESDIRNYYDHISSLQEKSRPFIQKALEVVSLCTLGRVYSGLNFTVNALGEEDKALRANVKKTEADRDAIYLANGVLSPEEVRNRLSADDEGGYQGLDVDDIPDDVEGEPDEEDIHLGGGIAESLRLKLAGGE